MKTELACLSIVALLATHKATAACEKPAIPSVPDGASTTEDQLLTAQDQIKAYVSAMDLYIACENEAMTVGTEAATASFLILMSDRIDAARDEVDVVVTGFNDQVESFRAARQAGAIAPR